MVLCCETQRCFVFKNRRKSRGAVLLLLASIAAITTVMALGALTAGAANKGPSLAKKAAAVSWLYNQHGNSVPMATCPYIGCTDRYFGNGTAVTMLCFADMGISYTGNYTSNRWFLVRYSNWFGSINRWVHSSYVYYQSWVGRC